MPMFDDPKKELEKLEAQLLKDEEWFETELAEARALSREPAPKKTAPAAKPVRQTPGAQTNPQIRNYANDYGRNVPGAKAAAPKEKGIRGLVILAILETLGIVAVVIYWLLFML